MNTQTTKPHKFTFGKFKGDLVSDHINARDKSYLLWADNNVAFFNLTESEKEQLDNIVSRTRRGSSRYGWDDNPNATPEELYDERGIAYEGITEFSDEMDSMWQMGGWD